MNPLCRKCWHEKLSASELQVEIEYCVKIKPCLGLPLALAGGMSSICGYKSVSQGKWRIHFLRLFAEREELCSAPGNSKNHTFLGKFAGNDVKWKMVDTLWLLRNTLGREESVAAYPFLIGQYGHVPLVVGLSWCCHPPKNQSHVAVDPA